GGIEDPCQLAAQIELRTVARDRGKLPERRLELGAGNLWVASGALDEPRRHALLGVKQHLQQVQRGKLLVAPTKRECLRALDEPPRPFRVLFDVHATLLCRIGPPRRHGAGRPSVDPCLAGKWSLPPCAGSRPGARFAALPGCKE